MKVCVIGNGHVGALKSGWDVLRREAAFAGVCIDFFVVPKDGVKHLKATDGILEATDENVRKHLGASGQGKERIVIRDYDCFVIHGVMSFNKVARIHASGRHASLSWLANEVDRNVAVGLAAMVAAQGIPALISTEPKFPSRIMASTDNYRYDTLVDGDLELTQAGTALMAAWQDSVARHQMVEQPEETVEARVFTRNEYLGEQAGGLHMGVRFGAMSLSRIVREAQARVERLGETARESRPEAGSEAVRVSSGNPYGNLPASSYWKLAVADSSPNTLRNLYRKRFSLSGKRIATAGSCFAQEIAKGLRRNGYQVLDKEPSPNSPEIRGELETRYGYKLYSARHGNIYTVRQLLQLTKEALGLVAYPEEAYVWTRDGRYFDAFRPSVEPKGLPSAAEVVLQRKDHLRRFRAVIEESDVFIFTLGLTETWVHKAFGAVYPTAPGVIAGEFDPAVFAFHNLSHDETYNDFVEFRELFRSANPRAKFIVTVSPVPLTATAADAHVLLATVRSKSILRAVAARLYDEFPDVDYFPSYELFSTPFLGGSLFQENRRSVKREGVDAVMKIFFGEHGIENASPTGDAEGMPGESVCEEALLEAFAPTEGK